MPPTQGLKSPSAYSEVEWLRSDRSLWRKVVDAVLRTTPAPLPRIAGAATPKEEAIGLLNAAAEIEHALLVQYLYGYYSVEEPDAPLAITLMEIAKQEMGHFITVQNLLLLLGAPVHCDRDAILPGSAFEPLRFTLEPLSATSLGKYLLIEAPDTKALPVEMQKRVAQVSADLGSAAIHLRRVGEIYSMLAWLFQKDDSSGVSPMLPTSRFTPGWHLGDADFVPSAAIIPFLADAIEWRGGSGREIHIDMPADRGTALNAIATIANQGEGAENEADSHFERFLIAYEGLRADPPVIVDVPSHANTLAVSSGDAAIEAGRITHSVARSWAVLVNARYNMLLTSIALSLTFSRNGTREAAFRAKCTQWAFEEMLRGISGGARILRRLPLKDGSSRFAAVPFEVQRVATARADLISNMRALLAMSTAIQEDLLANSSPGLAETQLLRALRRINEARLTDLNAIP